MALGDVWSVRWKGPYWEPRDIWLGVYWDFTRPPCRICTKHWRLDVYVCLLPCFPIRITLV